MSAEASTLDQTLLWLCAIDSPIGEERALCDAVIERFKNVTLAAPIRRYGDSIVVPWLRGKADASGQPAPHIVLAGHLDTVRTENGPARIEGDRCFGSGSSDMKSGLGIMLTLAESLLPKDVPFNVTLVFYAREEGPFNENELGPVLDLDPELHAVDLAVCLEPSDNKLHLGCTGSIHARVTFLGKTSHSARPWQGVNAVYKAAPLLLRLEQLKPVEVTLGGMLYRTVTSVTQANDGARGRNVVPDRFVLNVNHRFSPDRTLEGEQQYLRDLVGDVAEIEFTDLSPSAPPFRDHPLVQKLVDCGVRSIEPKQAWTDVARFAALGIAAVNFGPGENAQAHQKNESTSLPLLHEGYAIMRRWLTT